MNDVSPGLDVIPEAVFSASDYEVLAPKFIAADRLAYLAGGSASDSTLQRNRSVFNQYAIYPRLFGDLTGAHSQISLLGQQFSHPIMLAPLAHQGLVHKQSELATARGANATDTCMIASTLSTLTLEKIAAEAQQCWFQLYFQHSEEQSALLVQRALNAGYQAIVVTVDGAIQTPSHGALKANFIFPKNLRAANLTAPEMPQSSAGVFDTYRQNAPNLAQLSNLIKHCPVPVIVKGVMHAQDAVMLKELGAAAIIVSNHGGRAIDGAPASLSLLSGIRAAVGAQYPLLFDSGIRSGSDVFKAIALGADAVLIGRLQVYALAVAGALGVAHMLKLLRQELELSMAQAGCATIADIKTCELHHYQGNNPC